MSGNAYAGCTDDLDRNWEWSPGKQWMKWTIKNKSNKHIVITSIGLKAKDGSIMREEKPWHKVYDKAKDSYPVGDEDFYLKPYGISIKLIFTDDLNLDVSGSGYTSCKYGTRPVVTKQNKKSSSSNTTKPKEQSGTSGSSKSLLKKLLGKN